MPKPQTFPLLYDEMKTVSISFLVQYGYLKLNQWQSGTITWSTNTNQTDSISIQVNTQSEKPYFELDYQCNATPINYRVQLVSVTSNLGKGVVWYFICPVTGKRCRKLFLADTYFCHREAFRGGMYEKQTQSKKYRKLNKTLGLFCLTEELFEQLYRKNFKKAYAGKPTKKYLKLAQQIQKAQSVTHHEIEQVLKS